MWRAHPCSQSLEAEFIWLQAQRYISRYYILPSEETANNRTLMAGRMVEHWARDHENLGSNPSHAKFPVYVSPWHHS